MKTSSYDHLYEDEEPIEDEPQMCEPVPASYQRPDSPESPVAQGYEASFAMCNVQPVARTSDESVEGFEASFFKCNVATVADAPTVEGHEASFAKCSITPIAESSESPVTEYYETPIGGSSDSPAAKNYRTPIEESSEAPVAIVIPKSDKIISNEPPPVPKRTLLPTKIVKESPVIEESKDEITEAPEEAFQNAAYRDIEIVSPEDFTQKIESGAERWSDSTSVSLPGQIEDVETISSDPGNAQCDPVSEMYYTASSELSLVSDTELADKVQNDDDEQSKDDRKNVILGHVAAMRERFESMTRTNTPCPDLIRSLSPSLEVFRTTSPSPDRLT